jgi:hypothetical protein
LRCFIFDLSSSSKYELSVTNLLPKDVFGVEI